MMKIKDRDKDKKTIDKNRVIDDYPIFCFKHLQENSLKDCKDSKFYFDFLIRLRDLSNLGWKEIYKSHKHSFGTSKIPISKLKPDMPSFITKDVTELTVFRANGDNRPFIGLQNKNQFHVIFIETKFGDIYNHG